VLPMLEVLVIVIVAVRMVVPMLLRPELMHLLGAGSVLVWATVYSRGHCNAC
jgi:hypothetical protein